jgi:hypothetical protein
MSYRWVSTWPPAWTSLAQKDRCLWGEIGVLKEVRHDARFPHRCHLVIDFHGESLMGTLLCDDVNFCRLVAGIFRNRIDCPISELGSLDISYTY